MIGWYDAAYPRAEATKLIQEQHDADMKALQEQVQRIQARLAREKGQKRHDGALSVKPAT